MTFNLKKILEAGLHGIMVTQAPEILKGMLNEVLTKEKIGVNEIIPMITEDKSLWSLLPHYDKALNAMSKIGNIDWLDYEYLVDAVREQHPAIASLFLSWGKGRYWLKRQVTEIKSEIAKLTANTR